jgi:hypothetical protein
MKPHSFAIRLAIFAVSAILSGIGAAQTITFRVEMSVQDSIGRFDSENDFVEVRGPFNSWAGTAMSLMEGSTSVYEAEVEIFDSGGTEIDYKFFVNSNEFGDLWEPNVGAGDSGNRTLTFEEGGQVLDPAFFANLESAPGAGIEVTFQVDMALLIASETFLPGSDFLEARGVFNNWAGGFELEPIEEGSTIFQGTTKIKTLSLGSSVEYKYIYNGGIWEDGSNRTFILAKESPQTIPSRYFNDIGPDSALPEDTKILFTVDMNGAKTTDGTPFDPESYAVYINGAFVGTTWWDWGNPPFDFELVDDGSAESGDVTARDGIYSITFQSFAGDARKAEYKYSINGEDNEAGFQVNRVRYVRESGTYSCPTDIFGDMVQEPETLSTAPGPIDISGPVDGMVTVSWENPNAILERSDRMTAESWVEVPDSQGKGEMTFPAASPTASYFRLVVP